MSAPPPVAQPPARMGRYAIVGPLASGGMAEILLGKLLGPSGFERAVVIKRILPHLAREPHIITMFLDEARIVARIRHPNVVQVHELGHEGDELFQVFEYLDGESAVGVMRRLVGKKRELPLALGAYIVAEALAGLSAAHLLTDEEGAPLHLVHRDVSPENVFITYDGGIKLLDFGVARVEDRLTRTRTGDTKGKFAYMSPEQIRAEPLDARSDLFAMGVVLHELTSAQRLFHRESAGATVRAICDLPIPLPYRSDGVYPAALAAICARALARDPAERYESAADMRKALLEWLRTSDGGTPTAETLAELMREVFADRIEEKRQLLRSIARSDDPVVLPRDADLEVELPIATLPSRPPMMSPPAARRTWALLAIPIVLGSMATLWKSLHTVDPVVPVVAPAPLPAPVAPVVLPAPSALPDPDALPAPVAPPAKLLVHEPAKAPSRPAKKKHREFQRL